MEMVQSLFYLIDGRIWLCLFGVVLVVVLFKAAKRILKVCFFLGLVMASWGVLQVYGVTSMESVSKLWVVEGCYATSLVSTSELEVPLDNVLETLSTIEKVSSVASRLLGGDR